MKIYCSQCPVRDYCNLAPKSSYYSDDYMVGNLPDYSKDNCPLLKLYNSIINAQVYDAVKIQLDGS